MSARPSGPCPRSMDEGCDEGAAEDRRTVEEPHISGAGTGA